MSFGIDCATDSIEVKRVPLQAIAATMTTRQSMRIVSPILSGRSDLLGDYNAFGRRGYRCVPVKSQRLTLLCRFRRLAAGDRLFHRAGADLADGLRDDVAAPGK